MIQGRKSGIGLKHLLMKSSSSGTRDLANLVKKVFNSYSNSIEMLSRGGEVSQDLRIKLEDYEISDRRRRYKRRKSEYSWSKESYDLVDDGYVWRKYGQKNILNAKHPRCYFRCTHKHEQKCQAIKNIQKIQDNPPKYLTTYYGHHTCTNFLNAADIDLFSDTASTGSSVLLSFDSNAAANNFKPDSVFFSSSVNQEGTGMPSNFSYTSTTTLDYLVSSDITSGTGMSFDDLFYAGMFSSTDRFDHDVLQAFEF